MPELPLSINYQLSLSLIPTLLAVAFHSTTMSNTNISKKRKFVADGVFYSELNEVRIIEIGIKRDYWCFVTSPEENCLRYDPEAMTTDRK